ncbi:hypothetical protein TBK1r_07050 [Stieleria magnilauensis]|uniref:Uncharacterized protein n=1 Tax=Stieleria magnilauensis TaxID=2527963 RepID=A0ABX5XIG5_9BACT|nr:hypothetical protein TBK1r_07050 [Planctomycetes bacterium TBK1r]
MSLGHLAGPKALATHPMKASAAIASSLHRHTLVVKSSQPFLKNGSKSPAVRRTTHRRNREERFETPPKDNAGKHFWRLAAISPVKKVKQAAFVRVR